MSNTGKVIRLRRDRGFGFIQGEGPDISKEYFFHQQDCRGVEFESLSEGMSVTFEPTRTDKGNGWRAVNVGVPV